MTRIQRLELIDPSLSISIRQQCDLLSVHRSAYYYRPVATSELDLLLMGLLDRQYLLTPQYGYRKMTLVLRAAGHQVNAKRVRRLMQTMRLEAIYPKVNTSKPSPNHHLYPYLLRGLAIVRVHQVWAADITYVPMQQGYMYLIAIIDLFSRYVLVWSVSNTMEADWCRQVLQKALASYPSPEIFNTDQGSQFTSTTFTNVLEDAFIRISMDGKGRALDNIFVERLWRTVKYEHIYLHTYTDGWQLEKGLTAYFRFYNQERFHQSLNYKTPAQVFEEGAGKKQKQMENKIN